MEIPAHLPHPIEPCAWCPQSVAGAAVKSVRDVVVVNELGVLKDVVVVLVERYMQDAVVMWWNVVVEEDNW